MVSSFETVLASDFQLPQCGQGTCCRWELFGGGNSALLACTATAGLYASFTISVLRRPSRCAVRAAGASSGIVPGRLRPLLPIHDVVAAAAWPCLPMFSRGPPRCHVLKIAAATGAWARGGRRFDDAIIRPRRREGGKQKSWAPFSALSNVLSPAKYFVAASNVNDLEPESCVVVDLHSLA